jgi:pimeloyl-ACP methyl ester carboxylesterase
MTPVGEGVGSFEGVTGSYDEMAFLVDNAADAGLAWTDAPPVSRRPVTLGQPRVVSALVWGEGPPDAVLLHGRAQNAHTWDTVGLALQGLIPGASFVAVDLPGHGHSGWRDDHDYRPEALAVDLAEAVDRLAPAARLLVGMSLGGLTSLALLGDFPGAFERLVLVDITPGVDAGKARAIVDFTSGPERFASFDEVLDRTIRHNPGRSPGSLRRGVLHNAHELPDGSWAWRWDPQRAEVTPEPGPGAGRAALWGALGTLAVPLTLVRGSASSVVDDADVAEVLRRRPDAEVLVVADAGHSIQGDQPVELAQILAARWPR